MLDLRSLFRPWDGSFMLGIQDQIIMESEITIRVAGLGHNLTLKIPSTMTVRDLKTEVERSSSLPSGYQRLIARGKKLDGSDDATLGSLGIKNRTSIMLLHNESYANDREGVDAITKLLEEIDVLEARSSSIPPTAVREMVTQVCIFSHLCWHLR
mmetsp:Transcript_28488/g.65164  ORF Transcript_28488/g.65164 Transcript_28488/m.65164 type:complete len:155 (-) Transcript_28488:509-973(-)